MAVRPCVGAKKLMYYWKELKIFNTTVFAAICLNWMFMLLMQF